MPRLAGGPVQHRRGGDRLGEHPVHALLHDGPTLPVGGVDEPVLPVGGPAVDDRAVGEPDAGLQQGGVGLLAGGGQGHQEARPLQAVPDGRAVGPERVGRSVLVVLRQRRPVGVEVLGDAPRALPRPVDDPAGDAQRPLPPLRPGARGPGTEVGLDGVHGGVDAAVGVELGPGGVPLLDHHALLLVPEALVLDRERRVQQLVGARHPRGAGGAGGQHDEGVGVGLLGGGVHRAVAHRGEPATVLGVTQRTVQQRRHAVRRELGQLLLSRAAGRGGVAGHEPEREDVGHPAGDVELHRPVGVHLTLVVEVAEAGVHPRTAGEAEQLGPAPAPVVPTTRGQAGSSWCSAVGHRRPPSLSFIGTCTRRRRAGAPR